MSLRTSTWSLVVCYVLIVVAHLYYPKWQQPGTEATLSYDVSGYYMYLPAAFIYQDLKSVAFLPDIIEQYHPTYDPYQTFTHESGNEVMKYSIGQAVMYTPFFAVAHLWASASDTYPADGFSRPYQLMISLGSLLVAFLGLYCLMVVLRYYFADRAVAITLLVIVFATNYLNYSAIDGAMTHDNVFTLYALLLLCSHHFHSTRVPARKWILAAAIGVLVGLMALTRPTEILAAVIPLLWGVRMSMEGVRERMTFLKRNIPKLVLAAVLCLAVGSLQLMYWKYVSGDWIVYSYQDQGFDWLHPHLLDGIFSYKAGWLVYTPVMLFALVGFWPLFRKDEGVFLAPVAHALLFIYVAFAWSVWWYGGSLGQRTMVQAYAVLAFPLAAFIGWLSKGPYWVRLVFGVVGLFCVAHNLWFTHQAHRGGLFLTEQMNRAYYWRTLFTFEKDPEDQFLLDTQEFFRGTPASIDTLYKNDLEFKDPSPCGMGPIAGSGSICLIGEQQNTEEFRVDMAFDPHQWIRASIDAKIDARRDNRDNFAQLVVRFYRNGEKVKERFVRMHRVLNEDWRRSVSIDVKAPRDGADAVSVLVWNGGNSQPALVLDNVAIVALYE